VPIVPGSYSSSSGNPNLFNVISLMCNGTSTWRLVIHDAVAASDGTAQTFSTGFTYQCPASGAPAHFGSERVNSTWPLPSSRGASYSGIRSARVRARVTHLDLYCLLGFPPVPVRREDDFVPVSFPGRFCSDKTNLCASRNNDLRSSRLILDSLTSTVGCGA
jgi:hypothetical protein